MGHKVHPTGFRVGVIYEWQSKWYADKNYKDQLHSDIMIRKRIMGGTVDAGISRVEIERNANQMTVTIHTAKPGIVIGRSGANVDLLRTELEKTTGAAGAHQHQGDPAAGAGRATSWRGASPSSCSGGWRSGARSSRRSRGRWRAAPRASRWSWPAVSAARRCRAGSRRSRAACPLHTLRADIDFGIAEAHTTFGRIGVKVWVYKGDIMPAPKRPRAENDFSGMDEEQRAAAQGRPSAVVAAPVETASE